MTSPRPPVIAIAGARIEPGQEVMISPDGTVVPWRNPKAPPKIGEKARVTFEGIVVGSDPDPRFMHFSPRGHGTGRDAIWRVPVAQTEVIS